MEPETTIRAKTAAPSIWGIRSCVAHSRLVVSIGFDNIFSPLHRVFANVSNPAPMHWRLAILQRQNPVAAVLRDKGKPRRMLSSSHFIAAERWPPRLKLLVDLRS